MEPRGLAETAVVLTKMANGFQVKRLARQLDFTATGMCEPPANVILSEHPQAQLQSKLLALAKPAATVLVSQQQKVSRAKSPPAQTMQQRRKTTVPVVVV